MEIKNPYTPVAKINSDIKNSFGKSSVFQEMKTPAKTTIEVNNNKATEIPSTPMA